MREADFQKKVLSFLKEKEVYFVKIWGGGIYTEAGTPDIICCIRGSFIGIELKKSEKAKLSQLQEYKKKKILENNGEVFIVYPENFEEFKNIIEEKLFLKE